MSGRHTDGPWMVEPISDTSFQVTTSEDAGFAVICETPWSDDADEANAHLISAAPDLLASVEELLAPLEAASAMMVAQGMALNAAGEAAFDRARAAIAKAKGAAA